MEYTIVVKSSLASNELKETLQRIFHDSFEIEEVLVGDRTHRDAVASIIWSREDIAVALDERDIPSTEHNIDVVANNCRWLKDGSIGYGWEILDEIIDDLLDNDKLHLSKGE